jgi:ubiquinone biosynthesis protein UbiJ
MAAPMPVEAVLKRVAALLNRNIDESTPARAALARLGGRSFAVVVSGLGLRVRLAVADGRLALATDALAADATVEGPPLALLLLLGKTSLRPAPGAVSVSGDPEVAQLFQTLLSHARPELEAEVARMVGEVPARRGAQVLQAVFAFQRQALASLGRNVAEYLREESGDLADGREVAAHLREVDRLRDDVERAAARLAVLEERRARRAG